jgi:quercetin dioxygenase-like cupin family protein
MEADGYRVYTWTDAPGTTYPPHTHATEQSHCVLHGSIGLKVGEQEYVLAPGDRDYLPANALHSAHVVGDEAVTYLVGERQPT